MLIAQISDSHLQSPGELAVDKYDSQASFRRTLDAIGRLDPAPDFIIHTGDATHHGSTPIYAAMGADLRATGIPFCVLAGNHDEPAALREAFADAPWLPRDEPFLHYTIEDLPVRLVCLDTNIPGRPEGRLCAERLAWLERTLAAGGDRPTLVAMHHPAYRIGRTSSDARPLEGRAAFAALLVRHPNVSLVIAGHVHTNVQARVGTAVGLTAPSTVYQFALDRRPGAPLSLIDEPPGYCLHDWTPSDGFTSQLVRIEDVGGPYPYIQDGKKLPLPWQV